MSCRGGDRKCLFNLLPSSDQEDEILYRSFSNEVVDSSAMDLERKIHKKKKRIKHSKRKRTASTNSSASFPRGVESVSADEYEKSRIIYENGSITLEDAYQEIEKSVTTTESISCFNSAFEANQIQAIRSCSWSSEIWGDTNKLNEAALDCVSPVELKKENAAKSAELNSVTEGKKWATHHPDDTLDKVTNSAELRQRFSNELGHADELNVSIDLPASLMQKSSEFCRSLDSIPSSESPDLNGLRQNSEDVSCPTKSPWDFFMDEIQAGNTLQRTISVGNERNRQRVYNTMFHVPWRCELLIDVGFFVCLDSFLSLLTIMPARILRTIWNLLRGRQFWRISAAELSDCVFYVVLACGVAFLWRIDISLIYHIIRGQGTIKLYVVYNVLEILDKLCQSFVEDVVQVLLNSIEGLANSSAENVLFRSMRFAGDLAIGVIAFIIHSCILLAQAITLSTCIIAHNNALLALLVSNNFAEIKSNVFKRVSKDNLHTLAYHDTVERFHITAFLLFVLAQNILEADGPWFGNFVTNTLLVYVCEIMVDTIKHSFLAKFNEIKPGAYSDFLEALCKQVLGMAPGECTKALVFIPLAPACVVIRVVMPVFASYLPRGSSLWHLFWIFLFVATTYFFLAVLKFAAGMGLRLYATWYCDRCLRKKPHFD